MGVMQAVVVCTLNLAQMRTKGEISDAPELPEELVPWREGSTMML